MMVFGIGIVTACENVDNTLDPSVEAEQSINYKSDEFLTFKNFEDFNKATANLFDGGEDVQQQFYSQHPNFVSLSSVFEAGIKERADLIKEQEKKQKEEELSSLIISANPHAFINTGSSYEMNVTDPKMALVLNRSGVVKIGNTLYQFNIRTIKAIPNGDYSLVKTLDITAKPGRIGKSAIFVSNVERSSMPIEFNKSARVNGISECKNFARINSSNMTHHITGRAITVNFDYADYVFAGYDSQGDEIWMPSLTARGHRAYLEGHTEYRGIFGRWFDDQNTNSSMEGKFGYTINNVTDPQAYVNASVAGNGSAYKPKMQHYYGQQIHPKTSWYYRYLVDLYIPTSSGQPTTQALLEFEPSMSSHKFTWPGICDCTISY